jgi:hypothetical protein
MTFGSCDALATFQNMMDDILEKLNTQYIVFHYIDNILIGIETKEENKEIVQ